MIHMIIIQNQKRVIVSHMIRTAMTLVKVIIRNGMSKKEINIMIKIQNGVKNHMIQKMILMNAQTVNQNNLIQNGDIKTMMIRNIIKR